MPTSYPGAIDNLSNPSGTTATTDPTLLHSAQHGNANDAIEAIEAKLGIGGGPPPALPGILRRTGTGASGWGLAQAGDYGAGSIVNADIGSGANIDWTKLRAQGTPYTVPCSIDGTNVQHGYIQDIIRDNVLPGSRIADGTVTSAKIQDGTIVGGDISAAAALGISSLTTAGVIHTGGDVTVTRAGTPTTGVVYFGDNSGTRYLYYDGTVFHFSGQVNADTGLVVSGPLSLPARSITAGSTVLATPNGAVAGGGWGNASIVNSISGLTPNKDYVLVILTLTHSYTAGGAGGVGIGIDTVAGPSSYTHFSIPGVGVQITTTVSMLHAATRTDHTYYGLIYVGSASANVNGWPNPFTVLAFHA